MKKNGFTLVEILVVLIIISIIAIILIPNIRKSSAKVKENIYNTKVNNIVKAYKMCRQDGNTECYSVQTLIDKDYLAKESNSCTGNCIKNPIDNSYFDKCYLADTKLYCNVEPINVIEKVRSFAAGSNENSIDVIDKGSGGEGSNFCTNTLAYDGTVDNNLRYVGSKPCNYIKIGNSDWRIIGVMNDTVNSNGEKKDRIKLISLREVGNNYSMDGNGKQWPDSMLKDELNGDYLNYKLTHNTQWFRYLSSGSDNTIIFYCSNALKEFPQSLIESMLWKLGGLKENRESLYPYAMYTTERSDEKYTTVTRATEWTGKVGLPYPSDFTMSTAGGSGASRNTCLNNLSFYESKTGDTWANTSYTDCADNSWTVDDWSWSITPGFYSGSNSGRIIVPKNSSSNSKVVGLSTCEVYSSVSVRPTIFIYPEAVILDGNGSRFDPYIITY